MFFRPNAWPRQCPAPSGPGCACTTTKPPSAIAPEAASANMFLFIVIFSSCYKALFAPLKDMTVCAAERLQICLSCNYVIPSAVEESLDVNSTMGRDYNFWIYIVTNKNHSVLYIGVKNSLSRRTWQHREGNR